MFANFGDMGIDFGAWYYAKWGAIMSENTFFMKTNIISIDIDIDRYR